MSILQIILFSIWYCINVASFLYMSYNSRKYLTIGGILAALVGSVVTSVLFLLGLFVLSGAAADLVENQNSFINKKLFVKKNGSQ